MKTKRGVWAFQPTGFGSGNVPPKGDPKGRRMAAGASARQASLRGSGPATAAPEASGRTGGSAPAPRPRHSGGPVPRGRGALPSPRKGAGAAGLGACEQSPHAAQHGEKKARPPHCIRGHGTLAGQNARHTGHPPTLALLQAPLPFPRNASITSAPGGGFSLLLIANDFSKSPPHPSTPRFLSCTPLRSPPEGATSPAGCRCPPRPFPRRLSSGGGQGGEGTDKKSHSVIRRARGAGGEGPGCCLRPLCLPPLRGAGVYEPPASKWPPSSS